MQIFCDTVPSKFSIVKSMIKSFFKLNRLALI